MKLLKYIFYLLLIIAFPSCDKSYEISINKEFNGDLNFQCGIINTKCRALGKRDFVVEQQFKLNNRITLHKDSLQIWYNSNSIPFTLTINGEQIQNTSSTHTTDFNLILRFYVSGGIKAGDTIFIKTTGFLYCLDTSINLDTIKLYLVE